MGRDELKWHPIEGRVHQHITALERNRAEEWARYGPGVRKRRRRNAFDRKSRDVGPYQCEILIRDAYNVEGPRRAASLYRIELQPGMDRGPHTWDHIRVIKPLGFECSD